MKDMTNNGAPCIIVVLAVACLDIGIKTTTRWEIKCRDISILFQNSIFSYDPWVWKRERERVILFLNQVCFFFVFFHKACLKTAHDNSVSRVDVPITILFFAFRVSKMTVFCQCFFQSVYVRWRKRYTQDLGSVFSLSLSKKKYIGIHDLLVFWQLTNNFWALGSVWSSFKVKLQTKLAFLILSHH